MHAGTKNHRRQVASLSIPVTGLHKQRAAAIILPGKDLVETPQREEQARAARDSLSTLLAFFGSRFTATASFFPWTHQN